VRIHVYAHIRTIVVSIGDKLTGFYFLHLLSKTYCAVTTNLQLGKKVSYLSPGDVNPKHGPSRRGLLHDSPYHEI
jgi:hypothetical protein